MNMVSIGIYTANGMTAATGTVEQKNGAVILDTLGVMGSDVFAVASLALQDAAKIKTSGVRLFTNDVDLIKFLTPPISVKPTSEINVKGWGRVGVGGNGWQWEILYKLFLCGNWKIQKTAKLPGTENVYNEFYQNHQAAIRDGLQGCYRRLYEGVWASA